MNIKIRLKDFNLLPLLSTEEILIHGGDTGYYGSSPSQILNNMERGGKAVYEGARAAVNFVAGFFGL